MKRIYTYILLIACTMVLASCQKDFDGVLTATLQDYRSDSKVHLNSERYACWDNGDKVKINNRECTLSIEDQTASIQVGNMSAPYTAVYPSEYAGDGKVINLPNKQVYKTDGTSTNQLISAPMVAYTSGNELKFYNVCSLFKITIPSGVKVKNITISTQTENSLWGKISYSQNSNAAPSGITISNNDNLRNIAILEIPENTTIIRNEVYMVIPPISNAKLAVSLSYVNGSDVYSGTRSMSDKFTFVSNQIYSLSMVPSEKCVYTKKGDGSSEQNAVQISTVADFLTLLSGNTEGKYFKQTCDLDLGSNHKGIQNFKGTYDGDNHTITNGSSVVKSTNGVFASIGNGAVIKNVKVIANNYQEWNHPLGGLVDNIVASGATTINISGCSIEGSIIVDGGGESAIAGGICGNIQAEDGCVVNIDKCINKAYIKGCRIGGIVGYGRRTINLTKCANHGNLDVFSKIQSGMGGGLVGATYYLTSPILTIENCYSDGHINAPNDNKVYSLGGIIGTLGGKSVLNSGIFRNVYVADCDNTPKHSSFRWMMGKGSNNLIVTYDHVYMPEQQDDNIVGGSRVGAPIVYTDMNSLFVGFDSSIWEVRNVNGKNKIMLKFEPQN